MEFQWDPNKASSNLDKHGIDFADVVGVFEDLSAITVDDPHPDEERFVTIGIDFFARLLVVSYTWRNNDIRIISARKATKRERKLYEVDL